MSSRSSPSKGFSRPPLKKNVTYAQHKVTAKGYSTGTTMHVVPVVCYGKRSWNRADVSYKKDAMYQTYSSGLALVQRSTSTIPNETKISMPPTTRSTHTHTHPRVGGAGYLKPCSLSAIQNLRVTTPFPTLHVSGTTLVRHGNAKSNSQCKNKTNTRPSK